jgi:branched-chain amino acid transport system permease protein
MTAFESADPVVSARFPRPDRRIVIGAKAGFWLLLLAVVVLMPLFVGQYRLFEIELILLYVGASSGLNISVGYAGEMLLSQATVMGAAAYAGGLLTLNEHWPLWASLPAAVGVAIIWQLVIGLAGLRIRGLYLGLVSFFSVLVFANIVDLLQGWTGGDNGLIGVQQLFSSQTTNGNTESYETVVIIAVVSVLLVSQFVATSWGLRLRALRDSPHGLAVSGVSLAQTKLATYVVAAIPAGLCGWCLAFVNQSVSPSIFGLSLTLVLFAGVEVVGPGTILGPLIGTGLLEIYSNVVSPFSAYNVLGLGLLLAVVVLAFPNGLRRGGGRSLAALRERLHGRREGATAQDTSIPVDASVAAVDAEQTGFDRELVLASLKSVEALRPPSFASSEPLLQVSDLRRSFGGNLAVDNASFDVAAGSIVALVGDNGSGKTTIINLVSGLLRPDAGSVAICGEPAAGRSAHHVSRLGLTRTFQIPQLVSELTVRENVEVGLLRTHGVNFFHALLAGLSAVRSRNRRRAEADEICRLLGLTAAEIETPIEQLPLGMRRLAEVGRAIATGSPVVCLDEPAAGLNSKELHELGRSLLALRQSNRAVLLVEHNVRFVMGICDHIVLLRHGRVVGIYPDVRSNPLPDELRKFFSNVPVEARND